MPAYAGIGARKTPEDVLEMMRLIAIRLASIGYTLNTGAAKGADQAFANGALGGFGTVQLFLPWTTYEQEWISSLSGDVQLHVLQPADTEAYQSVYDYHPYAQNLSGGIIKLHARNFCIMRGVDKVFCWTPNGAITGGTGQAIRIALDRGIPVYNLGNAETYLNHKKRLIELGMID